MGLEKNKLHEKRERNTKRGSVNNSNRLADFGGERKEGAADWGNCNAELLLEVVVLITEMGGALIVGMSRDKGAHSLTLMLEKERVPLYFNADADLDEELRAVIAKLGD